MSANTSCRQRSPPGYEHEVTIQIYRLALANPTAVSRGSRRWPKFINFYKNVTIESRTLRDFEHRLAPPPQGPGPRDPGAKLARTPGPQRQNGPDPGTSAPNWPGPRTLGGQGPLEGGSSGSLCPKITCCASFWQQSTNRLTAK